MIEIAQKAALEAGEITLRLRFAKHSVERKGSEDNFSTDADIASEKKILENLQKHFPKHNFWSEELGKIDNGSEYWWIIDPIDGTGPYFSGMPTYGISIGLLKEGEPYLGVLNFPVLGNIYWAEKGNETYKNGQKIHVSEEVDLKKVMVGFDLGWLGEREKEIEKLIKPLIDKVRYTPILGCTIAGLGYVAEGIYGGYIHWAYPWDFAAGAVIIEEAGGKVTDYSGKHISWLSDDMSVVASNGILHDEILSLIKT